MAVHSLWRFRKRRQRLGHVLAYPPTVVAAAFAALLVFLFWHRTPEALSPLLPVNLMRPALGDALVPWFAILALPTLLVLPVLEAVIRSLVGELSGRSARASSKQESPAPADDFARLCHWIRDDREIEDSSQDRFGHAEVAQRIARRLTEAAGMAGESKPDMALIGDLGSGKSSILRLAKREIEERAASPTIVVVEVSFWPFDSPDAAVRGVLDALVRGLSEYVSTWAIAGVANRYLGVVEKLGGWKAALATAVQTPVSPEQVLAKIDEVALAAGIRIALWVEDLERFAGSGPAAAADDSCAKDADRLNPIRSLLYLLHRLDCVSVVISAKSLDVRFDMEKIARYVEEPPKMDPQAAWDTIFAFRDGCLSQTPFIDPMVERQDPSWPLANPRLPPPYVPDPDDRRDLAALCPTPRKLKLGLRHCLDVWEHLRGEVDFDDVLVMSLIRAAAPDVFSLVQQSIASLRSSGSGEREDPQPFQLALRGVVGIDKTGYEERIMRILALVFPALSGRNQPRRPQGFAASGRIEYWRRYLSQAPPAAEERDQDVLGEIQAWKEKRDDHRLVASTLDSKRSPRVEQFAGLLDAEAVLRLLRQVVLAESKHKADNPPFERPPGLIVGCRIMRATGSKSRLAIERVETVVCDLVRDVTPVNLALADELVETFTQDRKGLGWPLGDAGASRLRNVFAHAIADAAPKSLAETIGGWTRALLLRLCGRFPSADGSGDWDVVKRQLLAVKRLIPEEFQQALLLAQIRVVHRGDEDSGSGGREPVEVPEFPNPQPDDPTWANLQQLLDEVPPTQEE